jgi:hypothetical protein
VNFANGQTEYFAPSFQDDRRKLVSDRKERERELEASRSEVSSLKSSSKKELEEAKSRLIVERHEREKETGDHALMLRWVFCRGVHF